jgi:UDP-glucose 4-epimerase
VKVLVTGGAGFIGSNLSDRLVADGHRVVIVDNLSSGHREQVPGSASLYQLDIGNQFWLDRVFEREQPDAVCHLAAQISVRRSVEDPGFDARVNILGSLGVIDCCRRHGVGRLVFASTGGAIYGEADRLPTDESYTAAPLSPYGAAKLSVEHYLYLFHELDGFSAAALRFANIYGPRQDPHGEAGVVAIFATALLEGRAPVINGDGTQTRDYVFVGDAVAAFVAALGSDACGSFNIGTGVETDVNRLFELLRGAAGSSLQASHGPAKEGEQRRSSLDATVAGQKLGWKPSVDLAEGVGRTVDYFRGVAGVRSRS